MVHDQINQGTALNSCRDAFYLELVATTAMVEPGHFFDGVITQGVPPDSIDDKVQTNIRNAGYGQTTTPVVLVREIDNKNRLNAHRNLLSNSAVIIILCKAPVRSL